MGAAKQDVQSDATDRILLAAEVEFAERGFEGAGMKGIAQRAGVSQGLLHYHFGTKDALYGDVVRRRSALINTEREALLGAVDFASPNALEGILDALFRPPLGPAGGDRAYSRIFGGLVVGRERDRALVKEHYDPTARLFIAALGRAMGSDERTAALAYTFALGVLVSVISRDGRLERLMGDDDLQDTASLLASLIRFSCGGIAALCEDI